MRLGRGGGLAGEHCACHGDGVDDVGLAVPAADLPVRPGDLDTSHVVLGEQPSQRGAVAAGPFDADLAQRAERLQPAEQLAVASGRGAELRSAEHTAQVVDGGSDVDVAVGVDASGGSARRRCHRGHDRPSCSQVRDGHGATVVAQSRDGCLRQQAPIRSLPAGGVPQRLPPGRRTGEKDGRLASGITGVRPGGRTPLVLHPWHYPLLRFEQRSPRPQEPGALSFVLKATARRARE